MRKQNNTWSYCRDRLKALESRLWIYNNSIAAIDEISIGGRTYPVISYFGKNEAVTAYEKLQEFLK